MLQPKVARVSKGKIPQGSARARVEDDSQVDYMGTDMGMDTTKHWSCNSVKDRATDLSSRARVSSIQGKVNVSVEGKAGTVESKMLRVCPCGWLEQKARVRWP